MLVVVRRSVVSAHCAVVTLAVSARGSQVFVRLGHVYHALLRLANRSAHWVAQSDKTYDCPLAIPQVAGNCISARLNCNEWHFSVPLDQRERQSPKSVVGRVGAGSRSSGCLVVVVVSWFVLLGRCVVQRGTGRRLFFVFQSRVTSPRASRSSA